MWHRTRPKGPGKDTSVGEGLGPWIRNDTANDCAQGATVELQQPLGDRLFIDVWDWNRIPMRGE